MIQETLKNPRAFHLAGVIPVAGRKLDFEMPWHDALMPIAPNYLAVERCVTECAYIGCETIWIVCNDDIEPLIRHRLGDYIEDPVWVKRLSVTERGKRIPIFYVPIHPNDRDKRDCLAWSVIHGALVATKVSRNISRWTAPDSYYVSFPYGVYPVEFLQTLRTDASSEHGLTLRYLNKTFNENEYLAFTFDAIELRKMKNLVLREGTGIKKPGNPLEENVKLPVEKRYSARFFSLDKVFKPVYNSGQSRTFAEPLFYYNIDSWDGYKQYLASEESTMIIKPEREIMAYREFNPIGVDNV